jgi:hypothetical protein
MTTRSVEPTRSSTHCAARQPGSAAKSKPIAFGPSLARRRSTQVEKLPCRSISSAATRGHPRDRELCGEGCLAGAAFTLCDRDDPPYHCDPRFALHPFVWGTIQARRHVGCGFDFALAMSVLSWSRPDAPPPVLLAPT